MNNNDLVKNNLFSITCPNCGAPMELIGNFKFNCKYCNTNLYVYPDSKVKLVGINRTVDMTMLKMFANQTEDIPTEMLTAIKNEMALEIGKYLLDNNYIAIEKEKSMLDSNHEILTAHVKVVERQ